MAKVAIEKEGPITVVAIDRFAEARNAVDPETAVLLRDAFLAFDADSSQSVAILTGRGGTFCAGYDLKVAARPRRRTRLCLMPKPRARWDRRAICCPSR
jgi:enoyl-CoA hydratase